MRAGSFILAVALTGCTAQPAPIGNARSNDLAGRVAGRPQACVPIQPTTNLQVLDSATLSYGFGRTVYVNHLRGGCPGLDSLKTMVFDLHSPQYCSGDYFRTIEPGGLIPGPTCFLGDWVPLTRP